MKPTDILNAAADLIERTGFTPNACAVDPSGDVVLPSDQNAVRFCVSGAARRVGFQGTDGDGSVEERNYLAAMDAFCAHVGTDTVMEWADRPGVTTADAVQALRAASERLENAAKGSP